MRDVVLAPEREINKKIRYTIALIEAKIKTLPGALGEDPFPLKHSFAEGVYIRELFFPKGYLAVGKLHKNSYVNFITKGDISVLTEEGTRRIKGPSVIISPPGTKRFGYAHEDTIWISVHPNPDNCTDIDELEKRIHADDYTEIVDASVPCIEYDNFVMDIAHVEFDYKKFRELTKEIFAHEKVGFWSDYTPEQQDIYMSGDWEAFSRSRGYTEEEINTLREWIDMKEKGESFGLNPLSFVEDLCLNQAMKNVALDKKGEIMKTSHIPSSAKTPYK